jgi:hypothetical protein
MKKLKNGTRGRVRLIKLIYRFILPLLVAFLLLIVSSNISRPLFSGSKLLDLIARVWVCVIFSMGYIILSDLEKYKALFYGAKIDNVNSIIETSTVIANISIAVIFGIFAALISWWSVRTFVPILSDMALIIALLNGILFFAPIFYQRHHFRL